MSAAMILCFVFLLTATSMPGSSAFQQEIPAYITLSVLAGDDSATCPSEETLSAEMDANRAEIRQILSGMVNPYLDEQEPLRNRCPCGGAGPWHQISYLNASDPNTECPSSWNLTTTPIRGCGRSTPTGACDSVIFPANGRPYSRVCGRINAYQEGYVDAFTNSIEQIPITLEDTYLDGISLTHGAPGSRQHIWTFAVALNELNPNPLFVCSCTNVNGEWPYTLPTFLQDSYFCATGNRFGEAGGIFADDVLFDGEGCGATSACCTFNNPPWFCSMLPEATADDLEVRLCLTQEASEENIYISLIDIYVQ